MAHPLVWPSNQQFFPMGILPATSLTQDLSPEQPADILLLGCGDPRHIFYTISTDVTCPPAPRKLDITYVLRSGTCGTRNILLYTLVEDDVPTNHIWDIFYHFRIGDHAFGLIKTTSLSELRNFWVKYSGFSDLPTDQLDQFQKEYDSLSKLMSGRAKKGVNYDASRSAANSWKEAAKPVNDQYAHYWEHGTTVTTSKELKKVTKLNPTFCYSSLGDHFDIDVNTFPRGYHFAPAFTPLLSDPAGPATNSAMAKAKQQLKAGLSAFQMSRKENSITLRFFVGDAFALCRALDQYAKSRKTDTQEFTAPWRATKIDLD
ncbi:unnamed protein product [Rhizoctonia solani]|uniref:DUF4470 domain-containing protein n=1 Tax=Rhizoctonia solani TaxID=456999 RepID=A0A8H2WCT0_9AGAM|nr:unnamed protein product [Rhizoctonia solani]